MSTLPTLEFSSMALFEKWLNKNHDRSTGIWLKIFKKGSGKKTVTYAEALDVSLCYGWIDGQKQRFDEEAWLQKFCPRGAKSIWSKVNIGHVERLTKEGKIKPSGQKVIDEAKADGRWDRAYDPASKMTIPEEFLKALSKNKKAAEFFKSLNKTNLFFIGFQLQTAKKQETKDKRTAAIIEKLAKGEKLQ